MHLKALSIRNFRAIEQADFEFAGTIAVIVGPNAIGKTTILEAVRLARGLLSARIQSEPTQVLAGLGALLPYAPQQLYAAAILRDVNEPITVQSRYELTPAEITILDDGLGEMASSLALSSLGQPFATPAASAQFFSTDQGQEALTQARQWLEDGLRPIRDLQTCRINLTMDTQNGRVLGQFPVEQMFVTYLEQKHTPDQTLFSYFPADRALPYGEQPIQLGVQDATQQIESHNSQPQLKYQRLKNAIFSTVIASENGRAQVFQEFQKIFEGLLSGRVLESVGVNSAGLLSIAVRDTVSGRTFDLDRMSSGEKGLILTYFLIARSLADGGLVLLDEPELHLNPAVCKKLLHFLLNEYLIPKNAQALVCSHSPELVGSALELDQCRLYHIVSETETRLFMPSDSAEVASALARLGTSHVESLLYRANVFVEGDSDIDLLEAGFPNRLFRYSLKAMGGRKEIERHISTLQAAEREGQDVGKNYFVFDLDRNPTDQRSSDGVRLVQWSRYCLENFLIDDDVLYDMLHTEEYIREPFGSRTELTQELKRLALEQIDEIAIMRVFRQLPFHQPQLRADDLRGRSSEQVADALQLRIDEARDALRMKAGWKINFVQACDEVIAAMKSDWDASWRGLCNGRRLFEQLFRTRVFRIDPLKFKKRIMERLRADHSPSWVEIDDVLARLLA